MARNSLASLAAARRVCCVWSLCALACGGESARSDESTRDPPLLTDDAGGVEHNAPTVENVAPTTATTSEVVGTSAPAAVAAPATPDAGPPLAPASEQVPADAGGAAPDAKVDAPYRGGQGGASNRLVVYDDPELECYTLQAYADGNKKAPFSVSNQPDLYMDFVHHSPWQGTKYIRSFRNRLDKKAVVHHMTLYKHYTEEAESAGPGLGGHPGAELLFAWAPGGDDVFLDPDVGVLSEAGVSYTLEVHYNNTGETIGDASGIELCVTSKAPAHPAGLAWLGTDDIAGTEASGDCTPQSKEPIHIIAAGPHMHQKGRHMKVVLHRAGGGDEIVHDQPFDFSYQRTYLKDLIVQPGDRLTTTCTYSEPAMWGLGTQEEMCYFFTFHWPYGALSSLGLGTIVHGPNACLP